MTSNNETQTRVYQTEREAARLFNLKKSFPLPRKASQALDEWHNKNNQEEKGKDHGTNTIN